MNDAETRAEHIDPVLAAAGWGVVEFRNLKLAVVEAKPWNAALTEGVGQAKNYAAKLAIRFTYSTSGQGIYGIDMETGDEGQQPEFPTPDELWNLTFAETKRQRRHLCLFRRTGVYLFAEVGHQRRFPDAVSCQANCDND